MKKVLLLLIVGSILANYMMTSHKPQLLTEPIDQVKTINIYIDGQLKECCYSQTQQDQNVIESFELFCNNATSMTVRDGIGQDIKYYFEVISFDDNKDILILSEARNALFRIESLDRVIMYNDDKREIYQIFFEPYVE